MKKFLFFALILGWIVAPLFMIPATSADLSGLRGPRPAQDLYENVGSASKRYKAGYFSDIHVSNKIYTSSGNTTQWGAVMPVVSRTSQNMTTSITNLGGTYTNAGAGNATTFNLPAVSTWIGGMFRFAVVAGYNCTINPNGNDTILGATNAAGDSVRNGTAGSTLTLMGVSATQIVPVAYYGTWNDRD